MTEFEKRQETEYDQEDPDKLQARERNDKRIWQETRDRKWQKNLRRDKSNEES